MFAPMRGLGDVQICLLREPWAMATANTLNTIWHTLQDTVTGFLLAGVGNVDLRKKSNFLVVTESAHPWLGALLPASCTCAHSSPAEWLGMLQRRP